MRQYNDDDIEVLGSNSKNYNTHTSKKGGLLRWWIIWIVAVALITTVVFALLPTSDKRTYVADEIEQPLISDTTAATQGETALPAINEFTDSINDVVFTAVSLKGCKAAVTFEKPKASDQNIIVAVPAADFRADNGEIVCEFIHDKEQLSRGAKKSGFCYVSPDGNVTIGAGEGEDYKESAMNDGGTFFRQYPLVMNGEMQRNELKGKSQRRALAFYDGIPTIVISQKRESIYDFAEALADYGFSHAIYLPGGNAFIKMHTDKTNLYHSPNYGDAKYVNYLIFKQ